VRAEPFAVDQFSSGGSIVLSLATSANGDLWVGLGGVQLARVRDGEVTVFTVPTPGIKNGVLYLAPDPDGSIWVGTQDTVLNFDGQHWRVIDSPWPPAATYSDPGGVWGLAVARDGTVWAKNLLGLYCLGRGAGAFEQAPGYAGGLIDFVRDQEGRLWTADFATHRFYRLPELRSGQPVPQPEFGAALPPTMLGSVRMDRDGTLWNPNRVIGGLYRSASLNAPAPAEQLKPRQGGSSSFYSLSVFEDREG